MYGTVIFNVSTLVIISMANITHQNDIQGRIDAKVDLE